MSTAGFLLLVEDNADDEALTLRAFKKSRITNPVLVARDGVEALDCIFRTGAHASREPSLPAVVFLDLKLPKLDGIEVLRRIRADERTRTLPVVMFTSSVEERDLLESYRLGTNSYVRKPISFDEFTTSVGALGVYWLVLNELPKTGRA
jgi:two-component system response regulator